MNNKKLTHLLKTGVLSSTLILSAGTGTAFANDESTTPVTTSLIDEKVATEETTNTSEGNVITEGNSLTSVETNTTDESVTTTVEQETATATEEVEAPKVEMEEPSLIPGDFFYFVKMITEKIRLAVTYDDYKEAKLLAEFAAERIAEANALIVKGKTEEAEQLLKEAISIQNSVGDKLPVKEENATVNSEPEATEQQTAALTEVNEAGKTEEVIQIKLANNIDSLLAVLEKIDNENAQQAILKNLQKSFKKLDKKMTKIEKANAKFTEKVSDIESQLASGDITVEEANHKKAKLMEEMKNKLQKIEAEEVKAVEKINNEIAAETEEAAEEQVKKEAEAVKKAEKQREKAVKAEEKQREKAEKAEEKQREKADKAEEKQREKAEEKQREKADKAEEKQREKAEKAEEKQREKADKKQKESDEE
jgi:hypothetical protein